MINISQIELNELILVKPANIDLSKMLSLPMRINIWNTYMKKWILSIQFKDAIIKIESKESSKPVYLYWSSFQHTVYNSYKSNKITFTKIRTSNGVDSQIQFPWFNWIFDKLRKLTIKEQSIAEDLYSNNHTEGLSEAVITISRRYLNWIEMRTKLAMQNDLYYDANYNVNNIIANLSSSPKVVFEIDPFRIKEFIGKTYHLLPAHWEYHISSTDSYFTNMK